MAEVHPNILSALPGADLVIELLDNVPLGVAILPILNAPLLVVTFIVW